MKVYFDKQDLEYFYVTPLNEIKGKIKYPKPIIRQYKKAIQLLMAIATLKELKQHRGLRFEYLTGDRMNDCSIRLNDQYRLIFKPISENEIEVLLMKEISKHYE